MSGSHIRLSKEKLRAEYLPDDGDGRSTCSSYVRVVVNGTLAGNAFACRWKYNNNNNNQKTICWVTQLVIHHDYRKRGLATGLLNHLRNSDDDIYGIMSSHPAACLAAAKAFGSEQRARTHAHLHYSFMFWLFWLFCLFICLFVCLFKLRSIEWLK